jgi:very-short-patch-repair endonuclease
VTIPYNPSGGPRRDVVRHVRALPEGHATSLLGFTVTTLERTVVDCAMTLGPRAGLVIADAALRLGADRDECQGILATLGGHRGVVAARAVVDLADDGAESAGESTARFVLLRAGLPAPQTQVCVSTHLGTFWADLGWPAWRLLAEYDGRAKYEANGTASAAVIEEKRRQDAIEETGQRVLRITKEDVDRPERLVARVLRLAPSGIAGRLRPRAALMSRALRSVNSREIAPSW